MTASPLPFPSPRESMYNASPDSSEMCVGIRCTSSAVGVRAVASDEAKRQHLEAASAAYAWRPDVERKVFRANILPKGRNHFFLTQTSASKRLGCLHGASFRARRQQAPGSG
eukprot:6172479-Pleurochrysis_carterae.AAC.1